MQLSDLSVDFPAVISKQRSLPEQFSAVTQADLPSLTGELLDRLDALSGGLSDAQTVFVAFDPAENNAPGWNLAHVILHITASLEEGLALGGTLARGADVTGRSRYEADWEGVTTSAQVAQRLAESRRISFAFLAAWPDEPHLAKSYEHEVFGPMTAISHSAVGIAHGKGMLPQVEEIVRQASAV